MALTRQERQATYRERRRLSLQAPSLVAKVADPGIADTELTPIERAVRCARLQVIDDLGGVGQLSAAKTMQVDAALAAWVVCEYLQRDVLELAQAGALVNRRSRRAHPLVADWRQTLDSFTRLLREVGLSRVARAPKSLQQAVTDAMARVATRAPHATEATRGADSEPARAAGPNREAGRAGGPGTDLQEAADQMMPETQELELKTVDGE
jgi:hypothetical protein